MADAALVILGVDKKPKPELGIGVGGEMSAVHVLRCRGVEDASVVYVPLLRCAIMNFAISGAVL